MKRKNLLIIGLATVAAVANISLAQDAQPQPDVSTSISTPSASASAEAFYDDRTETILAGQKGRLDQQKARLEQMAKAMEATQKAMTIAQAKTTGTQKSYISRLNTIVARGSSTGRTLVIPKDAVDAKDVADVEEDLNVMAHILDKAVSGDDKIARAMGIALYSRSFGPAAAPENLYIEGHGAIFFLSVNYPLLAPPAKTNDATPKERTSSEWEEARREISRPSQPYGGAGFGGGGGGVYGGGGVAWTRTTVPEYDADRVEELKKDLIAALKNAAHIRRLKSDETVTVVVTSPGKTADAKAKGIVTPSSETEIRLFEAEEMVAIAGQTGTAGPSAKLILRAKKSDAEAFQKGNLSYDEFCRKVSVILY